MNEITGNDYLKFTCEIWKADSRESRQKYHYVSECTVNAFLFLDLEMFWNESSKLEFRVHKKPNQKLKYLRTDSTHIPSTFKAVPEGALVD